MSDFLFFKLKSVSYGSYIYFADSLADALIKMGDSVTFFDSEIEPLENMERLIGTHFDAIFDFNSALPRVTMDDDSYFLNHLDGPFYDIILDHPLYHHDSLKHPIENMHVLCLDKKHVDYIKENYPHIKSVDFFAMTGSRVKKSEKKDIDVLFCGSHTASTEVMDVLYKIPPFMRQITTDVIDLMRDDSSLQVHEALTALLPSLDDTVAELFPLHVQACFLADTYLRALEREQVIKAVAASKVPLTLCGNGWKKLDVPYDSNITYIEDTPFFDTFSLMSRAKISLNIMPLFTAGTHDRVYSSMLNGSLCVTDPSSVLKEQFSDKKDLYFADINHPTSFAEIVKDLLESPSEMESISESGQKKALAFHTWENRASLLKDIL
ncbi:MAG: glycosyltransferase [Lachnospiraceae bacterium]|nr:glycosyltransferase [Lachnospiraceae bacterium]